jgi:hypothetical protein
VNSEATDSADNARFPASATRSPPRHTHLIWTYAKDNAIELRATPRPRAKADYDAETVRFLKDGESNRNTWQVQRSKRKA